MDWMVAWVENRHAPDFVVAIHGTNGVVDNEWPLCAYPRRAVYTGPGGREKRSDELGGKQFFLPVNLLLRKRTDDW